LPQVGFIRLKDAETGKEMWVDTSVGSSRKNYHEWWQNQDKFVSEVFKRSGVDNVSISTEEDYVKPIIKLFKSR